ncbi:TIM21-domain-containing protein [Mytilinidion resinicola]|uniref:Mitochondrial import inner membrane translocase subunit Tim21 n=1 Tax=Mytilinidion resinicola TaxID=574789 RepID=A0A6A6XZG1_9PEZI|nr:TIM21-domain-containing protein [Mytilinidion resinicola]KAF2801365.1 TIM21-domain-containing protein [Mytilinidion resinicola]
MTALHRLPQPLRLENLRGSCLSRPVRRPAPRVLFVRSFTAQRSLKAASPSSNTPSSGRKHITVVNDDGRVRWGALSKTEKVARTTQQTFNLGIVLLGVVMTGAVFALLYTEVFSLDSKTAHFNRATDQIRRDKRCVELLGDSKHIKAYGEPSWSRWARNRIIASSTEKDRWGTEHLRMHFYVEGPKNQGVVNIHMTKRPSQNEYEYKVLAVDVKGEWTLFGGFGHLFGVY